MFFVSSPCPPLCPQLDSALWLGARTDKKGLDEVLFLGLFNCFPCAPDKQLPRNGKHASDSPTIGSDSLCAPSIQRLSLTLSGHPLSLSLLRLSLALNSNNASSYECTEKNSRKTEVKKTSRRCFLRQAESYILLQIRMFT